VASGAGGAVVRDTSDADTASLIAERRAGIMLLPQGKRHSEERDQAGAGLAGSVPVIPAFRAKQFQLRIVGSVLCHVTGYQTQTDDCRMCSDKEVGQGGIFRAFKYLTV